MAADNLNNKCLGANCCSRGSAMADAGYYSANAVITLPWQPMGCDALDQSRDRPPSFSSGVTLYTGGSGLPDYTYWDVGLDFIYKAVTLDLRYWDTNVKRFYNVGQLIGNGDMRRRRSYRA